MAEKIGHECWLGLNTGNETTPTWVEVKRAKDVSVPLSKGQADVSRRESKWKMFRGAMIESGVDIGYLWTNGADTVFDKFLDSFLAGTAINLAVLDDDIATSGAQGLRAWFECFDIPYDQALEDAEQFNISIKNTSYEEPAGTLIEPVWQETP